MPDYTNGKIYIIRFFRNEKLVYIGSTTQSLSARLKSHQYNKGCSLYKFVQEFRKGNFKCCYIELLELCVCNNRNELFRKEGEFIRKYKDDTNYTVINENIAGRTAKERSLEYAEMYKEYKRQHPEEFEIVDDMNEDYIRYLEAKNEIREKRREYYQKRKELKNNNN